MSIIPFERISTDLDRIAGELVDVKNELEAIRAATAETSAHADRLAHSLDGLITRLRDGRP